MVKRLNFIKAAQLHRAAAVMSMVILSREHREITGKSAPSELKGGERRHRAPLNMPLKPVHNIHIRQKGFEHKQRAPKITWTAEVNKNGTCELYHSKSSSRY